MAGSKQVTRFAQADLEAMQAFQHYLTESETAATRFLEALRNATARIEESPRLYPNIRGEFRRVLLDRFPYALIFRETLYEIQIVAVAHTSRDPAYWHGRTH
jgi:toxin ParE1/3/4